MTARPARFAAAGKPDTKEHTMALRLGDTAPDFEQDSSAGRIRFYEWLGASWGVLFSHPADFTPVCTTELGYTAKLAAEFALRNVKVLALSVDPVDSHVRWIKDINETQDTVVNFPILADADLIGYPVQVTVGKRGLAEGSVDLKLRATGERSHATVADTVQAVERLLQTAP